MGRPAAWLKEMTGRSPMISPGVPRTRRGVEHPLPCLAPPA